MTKLKSLFAIATAATALLATSSCKDFLQVENPNTVTASTSIRWPTPERWRHRRYRILPRPTGPTGVRRIFSGELYSADVNSPGNLMSVRRVDNTQTNGYFGSMSKARARDEGHRRRKGHGGESA
jgi:hypothetical protein